MRVWPNPIPRYTKGRVAKARFWYHRPLSLAAPHVAHSLITLTGKIALTMTMPRSSMSPKRRGSLRRRLSQMGHRFHLRPKFGRLKSHRFRVGRSFRRTGSCIGLWKEVAMSPKMARMFGSCFVMVPIPPCPSDSHGNQKPNDLRFLLPKTW